MKDWMKRVAAVVALMAIGTSVQAVDTALAITSTGIDVAASVLVVALALGTLLAAVLSAKLGFHLVRVGWAWIRGVR